jgi:hypothetical protein
MISEESPELPKEFYFDPDTLVEVTEDDWEKAQEITDEDTPRETAKQVLRKIAKK